MADYEVRLTRSARKELESLDAGVVKRIFPIIASLSTQPRPGGCLKLTDEENLWRVRAGDYRVIYEIDDDREIVRIVYVRHRSKVYR